MFRSRKGFTLIELLVVIAIIAILAAILFPVFGKAKQTAQSASCSSNLKQLSSSLLMYVDTWNGAFPCYPYDYSVTKGDPNGQLWDGLTKVGRGQEYYVKNTSMMALMMPYTKSKNIWKCPGDNGCAPDIVAGKRWSSYPFRFFIAYATNPYVNQGDWYRKSFGAPAFKLSRFPVQSRTFVFNEQLCWHDDRGQVNFSASEGLDMHKEGKLRMNFAFMDGHVKAYPIGNVLWWDSTHEVWDYAWPSSWDGRFVDVK